MVAAMMAFCMGVSATSRWPMLVCATAASSTIGPVREPTTVKPSRSQAVASIPNAAAVCFRTVDPRFIPTSAKAVLQENASASVRVTSARRRAVAGLVVEVGQGGAAGAGKLDRDFPGDQGAAGCNRAAARLR